MTDEELIKVLRQVADAGRGRPAPSRLLTLAENGCKAIVLPIGPVGIAAPERTGYHPCRADTRLGQDVP